MKLYPSLRIYKQSTIDEEEAFSSVVEPLKSFHVLVTLIKLMDSRVKPFMCLSLMSYLQEIHVCLPRKSPIVGGICD